MRSIENVDLYDQWKNLEVVQLEGVISRQSPNYNAIIKSIDRQNIKRQKQILENKKPNQNNWKIGICFSATCTWFDKIRFISHASPLYPWNSHLLVSIFLLHTQ